MSTAFKVVRFLAGDPSTAEVLRRGWADALGDDDADAAGADRGGGPLAGRPVRVTLAVPVVLAELPPPRFAAVDVQWFTDLDEARANDAWLAAVAPELGLDSPGLATGSCRVVAEEVVLRGQDHLAARWRAGGDRLKMMSFGRRHPSLSPEEFSARWRNEGGRLGGEAIPDDVRGSAYVQNHPVRLDDGRGWPLDAVNEVYVERMEDLRRRAAWMAARTGAPGRADAVPFMSPTETWSMGVLEALVTTPAGAPGV